MELQIPVYFMKNRLMCAVLMLLCGCFAEARDGYSITQAYDFPVRPGTPAWNELGNAIAQEKCNLPLAVATNMTTEALVQTCFAYPLKSMILADSNTDDNSEFKNSFFSGFNGFKELAVRPDAGKYLVESYRRFSENAAKTNQSNFIYVTFVHWLYMRPEFIQKFTPEEKEHLALLSFRAAVALKKQAEGGSEWIDPTRFGLVLLVKHNVVIQHKGLKFDKSMLSKEATKYATGFEVGENMPVYINWNSAWLPALEKLAN